jgi:hypothetical protein
MTPRVRKNLTHTSRYEDTDDCKYEKLVEPRDDVAPILFFL